MKQIKFIMSVPVTAKQKNELERQLYGQTWLERTADKLYVSLTAAACVLVIALLVIWLVYCMVGRACMSIPDEAPATIEMIVEDAGRSPQDTVEVTPMAAAPEEEEQAHTWDTPLTETELAALLTACEAGHIDPAVGLGLIQTESGFQPDALNPSSGCYGYCQLNPKYFPAGLSPEENITTGIGYLAQQLERYDDLEAALTAYNAGHDTGDRTYSALVLSAATNFEEDLTG